MPLLPAAALVVVGVAGTIEADSAAAVDSVVAADLAAGAVDLVAAAHREVGEWKKKTD